MNISGLYTAISPAAPGSLPTDLEGACRALEKEFAHLVFRKMREAMVLASEPGGPGFARQTAEAMLDGQWAELASRGEGLGIWRALCRQLETDAVKSEPTRVDERTRTAAQRKEKRGDTEGSARIPGPSVGRAGTREAAASHPRAPGLPEPERLQGFSALSADQEGT